MGIRAEEGAFTFCGVNLETLFQGPLFRVTEDFLDCLSSFWWVWRGRTAVASQPHMKGVFRRRKNTLIFMQYIYIFTLFAFDLKVDTVKILISPKVLSCDVSYSMASLLGI